jgi:CRISPR/Cas system-associated exonuclease Cas4 (RecB family)
LVVVDYKTDRDESSAEMHTLQLRLYALALERYAGRLPDRALLYYLRSDKAYEVSVDAMALNDARRAVRAFRDAQESLADPAPAVRTPPFSSGPA